MTTASIKTYKAQSNINIDIMYLSETFWLTQSQIAEVFGVEPILVSQALHTLYAERELTLNTTSRTFMYFHTSGGRTSQRQSKFYNHDAAISVGYRINALKATHFRIWVAETLIQAVKDEASRPKALGGQESPRMIQLLDYSVE